MATLYSYTSTNNYTNLNWNGSNDNYAFSFTPTVTGIPTELVVRLRTNTGTPVGNFYIKADKTAASATFGTASGVSLVNGSNTIPLTDGAVITAGVTYWVYFERTSNTSNYPQLYNEYSSPPDQQFWRSSASNIDPDTRYDSGSKNIGASMDVNGIALTNGLVSYWKCNESSGNLSDSHGSNTLTPNNGASMAAGKIGNGIDLEASSSQSFSVADASQAGLDLGVEFTLNLWVNFESFPSGAWAAMDLLNKWVATGNQRGYIFSYRNMNSVPGLTLFLSSNGSSSDGRTLAYTFPSLSTWYMVTCVRNGTATEYYVNGSSIGSGSGGTISTAPLNNTSAFEVGTQGAANYFDGKMDEIGVWDRALSSTEIAELYNGGAGLTYPFVESINTTNFFFMS